MGKIVNTMKKFPVNLGRTPGTKGGNSKKPLMPKKRPKTHGSPASAGGVKEDLGKC